MVKLIWIFCFTAPLNALAQLITIRKSMKSMADSLMYFFNGETQNYPFCRLKLLVEK